MNFVMVGPNKFAGVMMELLIPVSSILQILGTYWEIKLYVKGPPEDDNTYLYQNVATYVSDVRVIVSFH